MRSNGRCIAPSIRTLRCRPFVYHLVRFIDVGCNHADATAEVQGCAARASGRRRVVRFHTVVESKKSKLVPRRFTSLVESCVTCVAAIVVATAAVAASIQNGVVPKNRLASVTPYLGDYEGQWNSSVTGDVSDGDQPLRARKSGDAFIARCRQPIARAVLHGPASAQLNDELDLLGFGCRSRVGDLLELDVPKPPKETTADPYPVLTARLDFDWGNCPSRVHAVPSNDLELALLMDPARQEYVVELRLLKRVQGDDKIVIEDEGVQRVVKVRRKESDPARCTHRRWNIAC